MPRNWTKADLSPETRARNKEALATVGHVDTGRASLTDAILGAPRTRNRPEDAFQTSVVDLLTLRGFRVYHTFDSRHSVPGFPDLIAVRSGTCLALELKVPPNTPTTEQEAWLEAFGTVPGCVARVLYPDDWNWLMDTTA